MGNEGHKIGFNLSKGAPTQPITSPKDISLGAGGKKQASVPLP
jgi:hypothetical protein